MLIAWAKIPQREGNISPRRLWVTVWHTRVYFIYLGDEFFLFFPGVAEQNEHAGWI